MNRHNKFRAYWISIGKPALEMQLRGRDVESFVPFTNGDDDFWLSNVDIRIAGDSHWETRLKWIDSDRTLRVLEMDNHGWVNAGKEPNWWQSTSYKIFDNCFVHEAECSCNFCSRSKCCR